MIPRANVTAWRKTAPWPDNAQVEQDLVLSRVLVELFSRPAFAQQTAFRGGTARTSSSSLGGLSDPTAVEIELGEE